MPSTPISNSDQHEAAAFKYVRRLRHFYYHLFQYIIVTFGLLEINLIVSPHRLWALYVMGGWGLGVLMHAFIVFRPDWLLGPAWERRQVETRLGRPL